MWTVEETVAAQTAQSQSSSGSALTSFSATQQGTDTSTVVEKPGGGGTTTTTLAVGHAAGGSTVSNQGGGVTINQGGTGSWSESGTYVYSDTGSSSYETYTYSGAVTHTSSHFASGSYDGHGSSSGATNEYDGQQTTAGGTQTSLSESLILRTTASGTKGSSGSLFTATHTFQTTVPTLTTLSSTTGTQTNSYVTTTATAATSSGITVSGDSSHYLQGVYSTTTSAAALNAVVRTRAYVFAFDEDAWLLRLDESFTGMQELSDFASQLSGSYEVPSSTLSTVTVGIPATDTFAALTQGLSANVITDTTVYVFQGSSSSTTGLATPPQGLPNTTQESDYTPLTSSSDTLTEYSVDPGAMTSSTGKAAGQSASSAATLYAETTASSVTFAFDSRGRITGSSSSTCHAATSTTLSQVYPATTGGDSQRRQGSSSVFSTVNAAVGGESGETTGSGSTTAYGSTATSAAAAYSATSFLPQGTILEATFDPAVRFGTSGKFDSVDGPGGSVYYPFWSEVWGGLWMPMTYAAGQTTTYQNQSTVTETYADGSYTYVSATGPTISASYSWSGARVSLTTATGSGTSTGSGSTEFAMQPAGEDDASYFVSRGPGVGVYTSDSYGDTGIANNGSDYVVGGTQWADQPAQLWLGSGIWSLTSYDATGGSSTDKITVTDPVSISTLDSSVVVAARPIPSWGCVSANPGDPCLAVFTVDS